MYYNEKYFFAANCDAPRMLQLGLYHDVVATLGILHIMYKIHTILLINIVIT